ncbi:MAG: hypothetical protein K2G65_00815 [Eubacterium sp.]|nr:hypothetical protein [Eubacterium sp.]
MFEITNDVLNQLLIFLTPVLIVGAVTAVFSIISTLAVYYYNKSRGVKEKSATYSLIFLFGMLGVIVYYFKTKKENADIHDVNESKSKKCKIISIILIVIAVIGFGANIYASQTGMYDTDDYKQMMEEWHSASYDMYDNNYADPNIIERSSDGTLQK